MITTNRLFEDGFCAFQLFTYRNRIGPIRPVNDVHLIGRDRVILSDGFITTFWFDLIVLSIKKKLRSDNGTINNAGRQTAEEHNKQIGMYTMTCVIGTSVRLIMTDQRLCAK